MAPDEKGAAAEVRLLHDGLGVHPEVLSDALEFAPAAAANFAKPRRRRDRLGFAALDQSDPVDVARLLGIAGDGALDLQGRLPQALMKPIFDAQTKNAARKAKI